MRLLHVHSGNLYGGVETMLRTMARRRAEVPHHHPVFALTHEGRIARELRAAGCEVHLLGAVRGRHALSILRARHKLASLCRSQTFDACIVHSAWSLQLLGPACTRPLVLFQHDLPSSAIRIGARPDLVIANSEFTAAGIAGLYRNTPVQTIYPCVDIAEDARASRTQGSRIVILQAARFEPWKGHALLLDALATLRPNPDWVLWIAGSAQRPQEVQLQQRLEAQALRLGIADRVSFLGHVDDLPAFMRASMRPGDIYCQPNTAPEPFGLTFVEALAAQLAVVGTALGGAREILHPDWGLLPAPDVDSVAAALRRVLDDSALRHSLAAEGPSRARILCSPRTQIRKLESAIASLATRQDAA